MSAPRRVVFVCTGNICRSAMAEQLLRHRTRTRGLPFVAASAGVAAEPWYEVPANARKVLAKAGLPPFEHKARLATREVLRESDLILAMTREHQDHIIERFPEFASRTRLFREQAGFGEEDVEDPMGGDESAFARCFATLDESLEALLRAGFGDPA